VNFENEGKLPARTDKIPLVEIEIDAKTLGP